MSLVLGRPKSTRMSQWLLWSLDTDLSLGWKGHNPPYLAAVKSLNAACDSRTPDNRPLGRKFAVTLGISLSNLETQTMVENPLVLLEM